MRKATNVARENLVSLGTCFGKMTKSGKFRLHITALDFLAPYAKVSALMKWQPLSFQTHRDTKRGMYYVTSMSVKAAVPLKTWLLNYIFISFIHQEESYEFCVLLICLFYLQFTILFIYQLYDLSVLCSSLKYG